MAGETNVPAQGGGGRLRRWTPAQLLEEMQEEMARFWEAWPGGLWGPRGMLRRLAEPGLTRVPRTDVFEQDGTLVIKAEVPGIKKDEIEVSLERGDLVIRGEHKAETEAKEESYYRMERSASSFYRRLPLPFNVKPEDIQASLADGVLEVRIPKPAEVEAQPRKIPIR